MIQLDISLYSFEFYRYFEIISFISVLIIEVNYVIIC